MGMSSNPDVVNYRAGSVSFTRTGPVTGPGQHFATVSYVAPADTDYGQMYFENGGGGIISNGAGTMVNVASSWNPPASSLYSLDYGVTWNVGVMDVADDYPTFSFGAYGGGKFIVGSEDGYGKVWVSANAITWTTVQLDALDPYAESLCMVYSGTRFILGSGGTASNFYYSDNAGTTWTISPCTVAPANTTWASIATDGDGTLMAMGDIAWTVPLAAIVSSVDNGITWVSRTSPSMWLLNNGMKCIKWASGYFWAIPWFLTVGQKTSGIWRTADLGVTWEPVEVPGLWYDPVDTLGDYYMPRHNVQSATSSGGRLYVLSYHNNFEVISSTENGIDWEFSYNSMALASNWGEASSLSAVDGRVFVGSWEWSMDLTGVYRAEQIPQSSTSSRITTGTTAPANPQVNDVWIDITSGHVLKHWTGSAWV